MSSKSLDRGERGGSMATRDLVTEARSFTSSLANVFMLKKRDPQSRHLLEKAQFLIDALVAENQRLSVSSKRSGGSSSTPRPGGGSRGSPGGMGQLWVKLDELKRENDDLRRQLGKSQDDRCSSPKDKGPGDVIINDLLKTRTDNEGLKTQVTQLQKNVRELQAVNTSLQDEYKRSKAALDAAQRSVEKARQDYKKLESSLTSAKTENDSLKQKMTSSVKPMVRADNRLTENISERCRPSNIALRYNALESQQWVDAKEALEDSPQAAQLDEGKIVHVLCQALMNMYSASRQLYANVELVICELLRQPTLATAIVQNGLVSSGHISVLPDDFADSVKQRLRQTTDSVDTDVILSMATETHDPDTRNIVQTASSDKAVQNYLKECASSTWQMVVQNPPMKLVADDTAFDDGKHKLWWSCDQSRARKVDMFVWPVLYDYENGNVLVKGCVCAS
ncbi:uncharacterized protein [Littorina saxatilis]